MFTPAPPPNISLHTSLSPQLKISRILISDWLSEFPPQRWRLESWFLKLFRYVTMAIESLPVWDTSYLPELIYNLINRLLLCRKCLKPGKIQFSRDGDAQSLLSAKSSLGYEKEMRLKLCYFVGNELVHAGSPHARPQAGGG